MITEYLKKAAKSAKKIPAAIGLLLWPSLALADPGSALLLLGGALVKVGATALGYAIIAGTVIYGTLDARRRAKNAAEKARAEINRNNVDRSQTILDQLPPWVIRYGRTLAGSSVHAVFTTDKVGVRKDGTPFTRKDAYKHIVYVHAAHQCSAVHGYMINGIEVGELDDDGWATNPVFRLPDEYGYSAIRTVEIPPLGNHVSSSPVTILKVYDKELGRFSGEWPVNLGFYFGPIADGAFTLSSDGKTITNPSATVTIVVTYTYINASSTLRISTHLGDPDQTVDTFLNNLLPDKWTADHRLRGRCYSVVTVDLENTDFQGGVPQFQADLSGKVVFDPRTSTYAYSNNWALVVRDYLKAVWGANADDQDIDDVNYTNPSANASDVTVPIPVKGYTDNTVWNFASTTESWTAFNATLSVSGGILNVTNPTARDLTWVERTGLSFSGASNRYVRVRIRRTGGFTWRGVVYYRTAGHDFSEQFYAIKPVGMKVNGDWQEVVWDMHSLRTGGTDWKNNTITGLRIVLGYDRIDNFQIEWIAISSETTITQNLPKYTVNAYITTNDDRAKVLNDLAAAGAGMVVQGGEWAIVAGAWSSPIMDLDDTDVVGQVQIVQCDAGLDEVFNGVRATYFESGKSVAKEMKPYLNPTLVTEDGEELWQDLSFPYTDHEQRCQNLSRIAVERVRSGQVIQYPARMSAFPVRVGDRVRVSNSEFGFNLKTYLVTDWDFGVTSPVVLTLQEDSSAVWDLADQIVYDQTPNTSLPDPRVVLPFATSDIVLESGTVHLVKQSDGTILTRVYVSWPTSATPYADNDNAKVEIIWQRVLRDSVNTWRRVEAPVPQGSTYLIGASSSDTLIIGIRLRNSLGFVSEYTYFSYQVVGETQAASDVSNFEGVGRFGGIEYTWDPCPDADYKETELRVGASWGAGTTIFKGSASAYLYPQGVPSSVTVWAKHRDRTGNESTTEQPATASSLSLGSIGNYDFVNGLNGWTGVASVSDDSTASGGKVGNVTSIAALVYPEFIPIDPTRRYRVTARVKAASGGPIYVGVVTKNSSGSILSNTGGPTYVYCAAANATVAGDGQWYIYSGEVGGGTQPIPSASSDQNRFFAGSVSAAPMLFTYTGFVGTLVVDYLSIEDVTEAVASSSSVSLVNVQNATIIGGRVLKNAGAAGTWDVIARSSNPYVGGMMFTTKLLPGLMNTDPVHSVGVSTNPAGFTTYTGFSFGWHFDYSIGSRPVYNGTLVGSASTMADLDQYDFTYDGYTARWFKNGSQVHSQVAIITSPLYLDVKIWRKGGYADITAFRPMSSVSGITYPQIENVSANNIIHNQNVTYNFENQAYSDWVLETGFGELSLGTTTDAGSVGRYYLSVGNNAGNDLAFLVHKNNIPFNPNALYRIRAVVRKTAGTGTAYVGVCGYASDGTTKVNSTGANSISSQHYIVLNAYNLPNGWVEYVGYIKGTAATGTTVASPSASSPGKLHTNVKFFRPMVVFNYNGVAGISQLQQFQVEVVSGAVGTVDFIDEASVTAYFGDDAIPAAKIKDLNADKINAGAIRGINIQGAAHVTRGSYLTASVSNGATTITLKDTVDFPASGTGHIIDTSNDRDTFTYTGKTATTLTGCSGVLAHNAGAVVVPLNSRAIAISDLVNEARFFGNRGDGTIAEIGSIGVRTVGADVSYATFGDTISGYSRIGISGYSNSSYGVLGVSMSSFGVWGSSQSGTAVWGLSSTGIGVHGEAGSSSAYAAKFSGGTNWGTVMLVPLAGRPSNTAAGQIAMIYTAGGSVDARTSNPYLMYTNGDGNWRFVVDSSIWGG